MIETKALISGAALLSYAHKTLWSPPSARVLCGHLGRHELEPSGEEQGVGVFTCWAIGFDCVLCVPFFATGVGGVLVRRSTASACDCARCLRGRICWPPFPAIRREHIATTFSRQMLDVLLFYFVCMCVSFSTSIPQKRFGSVCPLFTGEPALGTVSCPTCIAVTFCSRARCASSAYMGST